MLETGRLSKAFVAGAWATPEAGDIGFRLEEREFVGCWITRWAPDSADRAASPMTLEGVR
ncbi:hypothetical protein [Streptomyces sp. NPDC057199]|uniref:hypothetical protein n=1 Tax=Streptomyces sp. NPDC057199 TaxID=3346047 RepID=UPI00363427DF